MKAKLKTHLQPQDEPIIIKGDDYEDVIITSNSKEIASIKVPLLHQLEEKYILFPLHIVVAYLEALQKNRMLEHAFTQVTIDQVKVYLKDIMRKIGAPMQSAAFFAGGMRSSVVKKNRVKRSHTIFVHTSPSRYASKGDKS